MIPLLTAPYQSRAFIAGGWAACPALANDLDVWILAPPDISSLANYRQEVLDCGVSCHPFRYENTVEHGEYSGVAIQIMKVGLFPSNIHLMVTDAPLIEAVLDNFDISTHQLAIDYRGQVILGPAWTPVTQPPQVIELRRNEHTEARLRKIAFRYGHSA